MAGIWNNLFGGDPERLIRRGERLAEDESWPEAIEAIEKALRRMPESDRSARKQVEERIDRYVKAYKDHLAEAIPRLLAEGNCERAEDLASIGASFASSEDERRRFEGLVKGSSGGREEHPRPEPKDRRPQEDIDALADSFGEILEPVEKEALFARLPLFRRGFVLWNEGRFGQARQTLDIFLSESPHDPYGLLYLGLSLAALGKGEEATAALERAVHFEPSLVPATLALSHIRKDQGDAEGAAALLEKLCAIVIDYPAQFGERRREEVFYSTIDTFLAAGKHRRAEELYRQTREGELFAEHLPLEARMAEARGKGGEAARKWELFLHAQPQAGGSIVGHGVRVRTPSPFDFEQAADFFQARGDSKKAYSYYQKGALQLTQRMHFGGEAISVRHLFRVRKKMAVALITLGRRKEAALIAEEMERVDPPPAEAGEIRELL